MAGKEEIESSRPKKPQGSSKPLELEKHPRIPIKLQYSLDSQENIYRGVEEKGNSK